MATCINVRSRLGHAQSRLAVTLTEKSASSQINNNIPFGAVLASSFAIRHDCKPIPSATVLALHGNSHPNQEHVQTYPLTARRARFQLNIDILQRSRGFKAAKITNINTRNAKKAKFEYQNYLSLVRTWVQMFWIHHRECTVGRVKIRVNTWGRHKTRNVHLLTE